MTNVDTSKEQFSIIIIPDTQNLSKYHPDTLMQMAQWITDHAETLHLKMVFHVGDVVNDGANAEEQFQSAKKALDLIDHANIPMLIAPGNHDYDNMVSKDRSLTMFNHYFGMTRYHNKPWFCGTYEDNQTENSYARLEICGRRFLFITLEFGPRDEVLAWVDNLLQTHDDHEAIIVTHCYMYMDGERNKPGVQHNPKIYQGATGANDGEDMWQKSFRKHRNIIGVFSGHQIPDNVSYRMDLGDEQNLVFQSFQNWQSAENGGEGRIRVMNFQFSDDMVNLRVYNPSSGVYETKDGYEVNYPLKAGRTQLSKWVTFKHPVEN